MTDTYYGTKLKNLGKKQVLTVKYQGFFNNSILMNKADLENQLKYKIGQKLGF